MTNTTLRRARIALLAINVFITLDFIAHQALADDEELSLPVEGIHGSLVICGGGRLPDSVRDRFLELGGGREARLVIIPTASDDPDVTQDGPQLVEMWKERKPRDVKLLHTRSHEDANRPEFTAALRQASAVWISGGRQTLLSAAYSGTAVEQELHALLRRGGVIGGTSAGAAFMSKTMLVRDTIHRTPGLGLLPGAIIDQHFLARNRKARLVTALEQHRSLVGFGVDEATALVIQDRRLSVVGNSTVTVLTMAVTGRTGKEIVWKAGDGTDFGQLRAELVAAP